MTRPRPLAAAHARLLETGIEPGHRSEAVWAVVLGMVNAGWSFDDYLDAFNDPRHALAKYFEVSRKGRTYSREQRLMRLHAHWRRASAWVADNPAIASRAEARQELGLLIADALAHPLAPYDQHVLLTVMKIATRAGRIDPTVSQRQIAEAVGLPRTTVRDVMRRLQQTGRLLVDQRERRAGEAPRVRLLPARRDETPDLALAARSSTVTAGLPAPGDLWCAWGQHARAVYLALTNEPAPASQIAKAAVVSRRTAQRWLATFRASGLADHASAGGYIRGTTDPNEVARDIGATGSLERRRVQYALEREGLAHHLATRRTAA